MKLTTKSEYLLRALIYIARHEKEGYIKIKEICREYDIPKKYLEQLFMRMKRNRYICTRRGSGGGYMLARPADEISVADVVRLMDGALAPSESVSRHFYSSSPIEKEVKIYNVMQEIRDYVADRLESLKISDLV